MSAHCTACGFPLRGPTCLACGRPGAAPLVEHAPKSGGRVLAPSPADFPELRAAFDAWGQRDFGRMISECLAVAGVPMTKPEQLDRSYGWIFRTRSTVVFVILADGQLALESPLVLVPAAQRTPMFRSLLELNERALGAARFCVRVDRVVLKYSDRAENVAPPKLMSALREVAGASDHFAQLLGHRFSAPLLLPEMKKPNVNPWQVLGTAARLDLPQPRAMPVQQVEVKQDVADMIVEMSESSFRFNAGAEPGPDDELELARDPYEGRHNAAGPLLHKLSAALRSAERAAHADGGLFSLLVLRAAAVWGRALMPPEVQGLAACLLANLGEWVTLLPEPGFKTGPRRPGFESVGGAFAELVQREGVIEPEWDDKVYPVTPFKGRDEPRLHVRKFMSLMTRCPKDDELRGLLLEGALCEMLLRAPRLAPDAENRVVRTLIELAPPSSMRVHDLQNHLTRSWP